MTPLAWSLILLCCGLILLALEFFVPSGGSLAVLATLSLIGAIVYGFLHSFLAGMLILLAVAVLIPALLVGMVRIWPRTPMGKRMLPDHSGGDDAILPQSEEHLWRQKLVGRVGVTKSKMLPSGAIIIDKHTIDAVSDGMAIDVDQPVQVVAVRGNRVVVRPYHGTIPTLPSDQDAILSRPLEELGLDVIDEPLDSVTRPEPETDN